MSLRRLRLARLLAVLAILLMVGLGQHVHAADATTSDGVKILVEGAGHPGDEGSDQGLPAAAHCGACHATRGVLPSPEGVREPAVHALAIPALRNALATDLAEPNEPSRPPKSMRAA